MGMYLCLTSLSDANIERVLRDPPLIWKVVAPEDPDFYVDARVAEPSPGLLARFFGSRRGTQSTGAFVFPPPEGVVCDLDKSWDGIHYLLTCGGSGGESRLDFLKAGGRAVGDIDVGFGPARVFSSAEARHVCVALRSLPDEALEARFQPEEMMARRVDPEIWTRSTPDDDPLEYLIENVHALRRFLDQAVAQRLGFVVHVQ